MKALIQLLATQSGLGLTVLRVVMGVVLGYSGYQKVFSGSYAVGFFRQLGIPFAEVAGPFVSFLELGGGLLLFIGLFTRLLGVVFTVQFLVASFYIMNFKGMASLKMELMMMAGAFVLATCGAGALGIDRPGQKWEP